MQRRGGYKGQAGVGVKEISVQVTRGGVLLRRKGPLSCWKKKKRAERDLRLGGGGGHRSQAANGEEATFVTDRNRGRGHTFFTETDGVTECGAEKRGGFPGGKYSAETKQKW